MRFVTFTINNEMSIKMRKLLMIEQYCNERFAESATRRHVETIQGLFARIFRKMMDNGLMIQMNDRQPEKSSRHLKR